MKLRLIVLVSLVWLPLALPQAQAGAAPVADALIEAVEGAWQPLGTGVNSPNSEAQVYALAVDGQGSLYAGGLFTTAGGVAANRVARWDGSAWHPLGAGLNNMVSALAVSEQGDLYAGGDFTTAGGVSVNNVARWGPRRITVDDDVVRETTWGITYARVTVRLAPPANQPVTVHYATVDRTATAPQDYRPISGTLTFNAGRSAATLTIKVVGDFILESDETIALVLSDPTNAVLQDSEAVVTIREDDTLPAIRIDNDWVQEAVAGSISVRVTVRLSTPPISPVTVHYATADGSARALSDYTAVSGTLTFAPGTTARTLWVTVKSDGLSEITESFALNLSTPTNATLADAQGIVTILNAPAALTPPQLSIDDDTIREATPTSAVSARVMVRLSAPVAQPVTVQYATADDSTTAQSDYTPVSGTLTFPTGTTARTLFIPVKGDSLAEADESFAVTLSAPSNDTLTDGQGVVTILDDDKPTLSVDDDTIQEGNRAYARLTVRLSGALAQPVTVDYATVNGTALARQDYVAASGSLTFAPGKTASTVWVLLLEKGSVEPQESFTLSLSNPTIATVADGQGVVTILDN